MSSVVCRLNFLIHHSSWTNWWRNHSSLFSFDMECFLDKAATTNSLSQNHILCWTNLALFSVSLELLVSRKAEVPCKASVVISSVLKSRTCSVNIFCVTVCFHGQLLFSYSLTSSSDPSSDTWLFSRIVINGTCCLLFTYWVWLPGQVANLNEQYINPC